MIGTGSTAAQVTAPLAEQASRLHVFQRTASWILPRRDRRYNALDRALARCPPYAALARWGWMRTLELMRRGFDDGTLARRALVALATAHRDRQVRDPALRTRLTPSHPIGCKRLVYSNDFYPAIERPNVELVTDPIARIHARGIVTADGTERAIDLLVCATGFEVGALLAAIDITGLEGRRLRDAWRDGAEAYHGITVAGFPNLFLMLGPNTGTGHTSTLLYIEPQVEHALACIRAVESGGHRWIEVSASAQQAESAHLQAKLATSVWSRCSSWYRVDGGRNVAIFPGYTREYVAAVRRPDLRDYAFG